jgi:hypothetical protein
MLPLQAKNLFFSSEPAALRSNSTFLGEIFDCYLFTFARASFLLLFLLILIKIASKRQNKRQCYLFKEEGGIKIAKHYLFKEAEQALPRRGKYYVE